MYLRKLERVRGSTDEGGVSTGVELRLRRGPWREGMSLSCPG